MSQGSRLLLAIQPRLAEAYMMAMPMAPDKEQGYDHRPL